MKRDGRTYNNILFYILLLTITRTWGLWMMMMMRGNRNLVLINSNHNIIGIVVLNETRTNWFVHVFYLSFICPITIPLADSTFSLPQNDCLGLFTTLNSSSHSSLFFGINPKNWMLMIIMMMLMMICWWPSCWWNRSGFMSCK